MAAAVCLAGRGHAQDAASTNGAMLSAPPTPTNAAAAKEQDWNVHMEATYIGDGIRIFRRSIPVLEVWTTTR